MQELSNKMNNANYGSSPFREPNMMVKSPDKHEKERQIGVSKSLSFCLLL